MTKVHPDLAAAMLKQTLHLEDELTPEQRKLWDAVHHRAEAWARHMQWTHEDTTAQCLTLLKRILAGGEPKAILRAACSEDVAYRARLPLARDWDTERAA